MFSDPDMLDARLMPRNLSAGAVPHNLHLLFPHSLLFTLFSSNKTSLALLSRLAAVVANLVKRVPTDMYTRLERKKNYVS